MMRQTRDEEYKSNAGTGITVPEDPSLSAWYLKHIFPLSSNKWFQHSVGWSLGAVGAGVAFNLGGDFGEEVGELFGCNSYEKKFLYGLFGVCAFISLASLFGVNTSDYFASSDFQSDRSLSNALRLPAKSNVYVRSTAWFFAMISALQYAFVVGVYLDVPILSILFAIVGFFVYALSNYRAELAITDEMFDFFHHQRETDAQKANRAKLKRYGENILRGVYHSTDEEINNIYSTFSTAEELDDKLRQLNLLSRQKEVTSTTNERMPLFQESATAKPESEYPFSMALKFVGGVLAFTLGAGVGYIYYALTLRAVRWFFGLAFMHRYFDPHSVGVVIFSQIIAYFGTIGNASLGGLKTMKWFFHMWNLTIHEDYRVIQQTTCRALRRASIVIGFIAGGFAATPLTYLLFSWTVLHRYGDWLTFVIFLPSTYLAPACVRSDSFMQMWGRMLDSCLELFYLLRNDRGNNSKRDVLIEIVNKLEQTFPKLTPSGVSQMLGFFEGKINHEEPLPLPVSASQNIC